jgi:hypothetical protein
LSERDPGSGIRGPTAYRYRPDVLERLETHGIRPRSTTRPELVREFVNDLYRYEIRQLRDRLRRGEFPKQTYYDRVVALRNRYTILALKPFQFVE